MFSTQLIQFNSSVFGLQIETTQPMPVMVVIHPGFFLFGQGAMLHPQFFMDEDVVVVTFNYRLGALGKMFHCRTFEE